jgi:hypothetical protein
MKDGLDAVDRDVSCIYLTNLSGVSGALLVED